MSRTLSAKSRARTKTGPIVGPIGAPEPHRHGAASRGARPVEIARTVGEPSCLWHDGRERLMPAPTAADVRVLDVPEHSRFEIRVGSELAGFAEYRRRPSLIAFTHTLIDPRFEGQGLAHQLAETALSDARSAGLAVLPFCPFMRSFIASRSDEYLDLVPDDLRGAFDLSADA